MITQPCESSGYESVIHDSETSSLMTTSRTPQEIPEKDSTTITTGNSIIFLKYFLIIKVITPMLLNFYSRT